MANKTTAVGGGGLGCLGLIIIISLIAWAGCGMEARAAVWLGIKLSAAIYGGLLLLIGGLLMVLWR